MVVVACCDPKQFRRTQLAKLNKNHIIDEKMQFDDWKTIAKVNIIDSRIVCHRTLTF
jgi:hypothetical protein